LNEWGELPGGFDVADEGFTHAYFLTDGIYPDWPIFMKALEFPQTEAEEKFTKLQESVRKDVERMFGVLQKRWKILRTGFTLHKIDEIITIVKACVILHNMIVEGQRKGLWSAERNSTGDTATDIVGEFGDGNDTDKRRFDVKTVVETIQTITDKAEYRRLQRALIAQFIE
jgi:hypothetical protein